MHHASYLFDLGNKQDSCPAYYCHNENINLAVSLKLQNVIHHYFIGLCTISECRGKLFSLTNVQHYYLLEK